MIPAVHVKPHSRKIYATHMLTRGTPRSGMLVPPKQRKVRGHFYLVDKLVGDDNFIFLSLESVHGTKADIYVFDAEKLVREGALVRVHDIAGTEEWDDFIKYLEMEPDFSGYDVDNYDSVLMLIDQDPRTAELFEALMDKREKITLRGAAAIEFLERYPEGHVKMLGPPEILVPRRLHLSEAEGVYVIGRKPR